MDFQNYINNMSKPDTFKPTGITKDYYLDIIEICVNAYSVDELESKLPKDDMAIIEDIQAYSRVTSAIAILMANGRKQEYLPLWIKMMDACCSSAYRTIGDARLDFSVKEIMLAYKAMKDRIPEEKRKIWLEMLEKVDPYKNFHYVIRDDASRKGLHNINIYNMSGEYLRETEHLTDTDGYFEEHWPEQLKRFDENGMYMDPACPMLYDLTTRCQIQIMMQYGYRGKFYEAIDERLKKSGMYTLFMQSAAFEFPFGGRSNQFLFNEALIAANCEYEATRYKSLGDLNTAGSFKRCAHLSVKAIQRWLKEVTPPRHIKNFYPIESRHGTEGYGYYDKYMATLGCFIYIAYISADDTIEEYPCPAEIGGYVLETSEVFHKVFASCSGNSIEIDTKADFHYDATGLGRYHKIGVPTELAISVPFSSEPNYSLAAGFLKRNASICAGWEYEEGKVQYLSELSEGLEHELIINSRSKDNISFILIYRGEAIKGCKAVKEIYILSAEGVKIETELIDPEIEKIFYMVPLFVTNGKDNSTISSESNSVVVKLNDSTYNVFTDGSIHVENERLGNRNGEYYLAIIKKDSKSIEINLSLKK